MGKVYSSRDVIRLLEDDGWCEVRVTGSHHNFKHQVKRGIARLHIRKRRSALLSEAAQQLLGDI